MMTVIGAYCVCRLGNPRKAGKYMRGISSGPLKLKVAKECWPLKEPFRISGRVWEVLNVLSVHVRMERWEGAGEAAGVYFRDENVDSMVRQIETVRGSIEQVVSHEALMRILPAGGARNAVDCALWDLEAKREGKALWQLVGLVRPRALGRMGQARRRALPTVRS